VFIGPFHGAIAVPSVTRCVVVVVVVVVVDIDAQAARDSTASDTWWMGVRRLAVANWPNIFQMLLVKLTYLLMYLLTCRDRHPDKRAALHRSGPPADQSGKLVASWTRTLVAVILARMWRWCYAENGPVDCRVAWLFLSLDNQNVSRCRSVAKEKLFASCDR